MYSTMEKTNGPSPWVCTRKMDGLLGAPLQATKVKQWPKEFPTNLGSVKKTNKHIQPFRLNIVIRVTSQNLNSLTSPLRVFFLGRRVRLDQNFIISFHQPPGKRGHRSNLWRAHLIIPQKSPWQNWQECTPWKTKVSPENQWLEDVFPIERVPFWGDIRWLSEKATCTHTPTWMFCWKFRIKA